MSTCKMSEKYTWKITSTSLRAYEFNSLAPGRSEYDSKNVIFNLDLLIGISRSYDNALRWMPLDLTDDKLTLVQVMAWCHQATSHNLSQCWLSSLSPYGVARPQWVKYQAVVIQPLIFKWKQVWFEIEPLIITPYGNTSLFNKCLF